MNNRDAIDKLLRQADFASEEAELERRLWNRISQRMAKEEIPEFRELEDDALEDLAAAGSTFPSPPKTNDSAR